jgi:tRNA threonylcarbamoyladenosine biosynthesis protein TsaB
MSVIVGFDTATEQTVVGAMQMRDGELLFARSLEPAADGRPRHGTRLLAEVEEAARTAGGWGSVGRIAVGLGPGSFTGLRIGIATARALAQSLDVELVGVGTLAALAGGAGPAAGRSVLAVLDARRGEVFAALYGTSSEPIWEPLVTDPVQLAQRIAQLPEAPLAAGSGALRFRDELEEGGAEIPDGSDPLHRIEAREICALGALGVVSGPEGVAPIYLRPPDAERWRERDSTKS